MDTEFLVRDETVTLDGLRFHYRDWGDPAAPPLVLLHAYPVNYETGYRNRFQNSGHSFSSDPMAVPQGRDYLPS